MHNDRKQWFIDRIGLTVYRNHVGCECLVCKSGYDNGITITDHLSAYYLCEMEVSSNRDGEPLMYFDTIEQRDAFETILKEYSITYDSTIEKCIEGLIEKVGIKNTSAIHLFQRIIKNYLNIQKNNA